MSEIDNDQQIDTVTVLPVVNRMRRFLNARERASSEIEDYLRSRISCSADEREAVLNYLLNENLVNDKRFARNRRDYRRERGYGPLYIRRELSSFKIDSAVMEQLALDDENGEELYLEAALELLEAKLPQYLKQSDSRERLKNLLMRRGYNGSQISAALELLQERYPHWGRSQGLN